MPTELYPHQWVLLSSEPRETQSVIIQPFYTFLQEPSILFYWESHSISKQVACSAKTLDSFTLLYIANAGTSIAVGILFYELKAEIKDELFLWKKNSIHCNKQLWFVILGGLLHCE